MFVVLGHHPIAAINTKVFNVIFSFHIPLFFFVSGYLFHHDLTFIHLVRRRFNSILKPYLFTVIIVSLFYILFRDGPSFLWYLFWTVYGNGPNLPKTALHLWFLPSLFVTILLVWLAFRRLNILKESIIAQLLFVCSLFGCGFLVIDLFWALKIPQAFTDIFGLRHLFRIEGLLDNPAYSKAELLKHNQFKLYGLPWSVDIILITAGFFLSGHLVQRNKLEMFFRRNAVALIMAIVFCAIHYYFNYTIDLNLRRYDNLIICTASAYMGIYICTWVSQTIAGWGNLLTHLAQYVGKYSLIVFIFHPIIENRLYTLSLSVFPEMTHFASLVAFIAGISIPLLLNHCVLIRFNTFRYWYYANTSK